MNTNQDHDIINFFKRIGQLAILLHLLFWFVIYITYPILFIFFSVKIIFNKLIKKERAKYFTQIEEEFNKFRHMSNRKEGAQKLVIAAILAPVSIGVIMSVIISLRGFRGSGLFILLFTIVLVIINLVLDKIQREDKT